MRHNSQAFRNHPKLIMLRIFKCSCRILVAVLSLAILLPPVRSQDNPAFHHLHLNSTDPDAAIDFYIRNFPATSRTTWNGIPAVKAGKIYILFNKVARPPALTPQTAIWHFGFQVPDERAYFTRFQKTGIKVLPLYTGEGDRFVYVNSDTWPGAGGPGGALGRTRTQIDEAKMQGIKPKGGAGFSYVAGPDGAIIEYIGNGPAERFNHVHMYQDEPFCAQLWYQQRLSATASRVSQRTGTDCKEPRGERSWPALEQEGMFRVPSSGVAFGDIALNWYINPDETRLAPTGGHLADHFALSVTDLDAWAAKLKKENVNFLEQVHRFGDTRAFMIEGPSREAIEFVEVK